jgi:hypothetical protein
LKSAEHHTHPFFLLSNQEEQLLDSESPPFLANFVAEPTEMGLDARRGAGFPTGAV